MILTGPQVAAYAAGAGFTGPGLVRAVAVSFAENDTHDTARVFTNPDTWRSRDRGLWQINSHWHKEVTDAQAFNPATAAAEAYRISRGGKDWHEWATWTHGTAQAQQGRARIAIAQAHAHAAQGGGGSSSTATPADFLGFPITPPGELLDHLLPAIPVPTPNGFQTGILPNNLFGGPGKDNPHQIGPTHALDPKTPGGQTNAVPGIVKAVTSPIDAAKSALTMLAKAGAWMADSHNWARVAMVAGGTTAVLLSVHMIAESGAAGSTLRTVADMPVKAAKGTAKAAAVAAAA